MVDDKIRIYLARQGNNKVITMTGKSNRYILQGESIQTESAFRARLVKEHPRVGWMKTIVSNSARMYSVKVF